VLRGGSREGVDRLGRVADDAQLVATAQPQVQQPLLQGVDVLIFVDDEVSILIADGARDVHPLVEDAGHEQQDVLEVDDPALGLALLVAFPHPGHRGVVDAWRFAARPPGARGIRLRGQQRDLAPLDLGREVADGGAVELHPQPRHGLSDNGRLAGKHLRGRAADRLRPEEVQLAQRRGVEGARRHSPDAELAKSGAHLPRRPRGERHGENPLRHIGPRVDAISDPVGDGPGLAGARAGQHTHRADWAGGHLTLFGVEGGQDVVGSGARLTHGGSSLAATVCRSPGSRRS
jgi:hypothetical protein